MVQFLSISLRSSLLLVGRSIIVFGFKAQTCQCGFNSGSFLRRQPTAGLQWFWIIYGRHPRLEPAPPVRQIVWSSGSFGGTLVREGTGGDDGIDALPQRHSVNPGTSVARRRDFSEQKIQKKKSTSKPWWNRSRPILFQARHIPTWADSLASYNRR